MTDKTTIRLIRERIMELMAQIKEDRFLGLNVDELEFELGTEQSRLKELLEIRKKGGLVL